MAGFSYKETGGAAGTSTRANLDVSSEVTGLTPGQSYDVMAPSGAILTVTPLEVIPVNAIRDRVNDPILDRVGDNIEVR